MSQVALLPSYNSKVTVSLLCSLSVPIYLNFIEFLSEKRGCVMNIEWDYGSYQPWSDNE